MVTAIVKLMAVALLLGVAPWSYALNQDEQAGDPSSVAKSQTGPSDGAPLVVVTIPPLAMIAKDLSGAAFSVETLITGDRDPHRINLLPSDLKKIHTAAGVFWVGPSFDPEFKQIIQKKPAHQQLALAHIETLELISLDEGSDHHHHHNSSHEADEHHDAHQDSFYDLHVWLSLKNRPHLIKAMSTWLQGLTDSTQKQQVIRGNSERLLAEWQVLNNSWRERLRDNQLNIFVEHDAYGYFLQEMNIELVEVILRGHDVTPSAKHMVHLSKMAAKEQVNCVWKMPFSSPELIDKIVRGSRVAVVEIDPLLRGYDLLDASENGSEKRPEKSVPKAQFISNRAFAELIHRVGQCK